MTSGGSVTVDVSGRDQNLVALLTRMEAQMRQTDQVGIQLAQTTGGTFTAAQQRAANAAIVEAQALARAAIAAGDDAAAHRILVGALGNSAAASDRSVAGLTTSINKLQGGTTAFTQFGDAAKSSLLSVVGPAAVFAGALATVKGTVDTFARAFTFKAELDATTASINAQLKGVRDTGQVYGEAARFANEFKLTQKETTDAIAASIGVMRNSKASVEDILSVLARLQVLSPEQSLQEAAVAVKALASGDTTSLVTRFEVGRDVAGQMKNEIAGGADAVQVLNKFLNDTGIGMDALAAKTTGVSGKLKDVAIAEEQLALAQAKFAEGPGLLVLEERIRITQGATRLLSGDTAAMVASLQQVNTGTSIATEGLGSYGATLGSVIANIFGATAADQALAAQQAASAAATAAHAQTSTQLAIATQNLGAMFGSEAQAITQATTAEAQHVTAMTNDAAQAQIAAVASQALAVTKLSLAQQAANAANAMIASGNAGAATANRLAASSSLVDQLTAAYLRLRAAQVAATGVALAATSVSRANSDANDVQANKLSNLHSRRTQEQADYQAAQAAARRYQQAIGNFTPAIERAQAELAQLPAGSAAAFDKMTELTRLKEQQAQAAKRGAGAAGGAARLSDQQKLNNSLLSDQERFADQAENAERAHQQKLLDIDQEFAKRSLEQQRANEVSKRQSRADFYDSLTSSTKDVGQQVAHELSAAYEAAYAQAQSIAQSGNQKLADDYLKLKQRQINSELDFQKRIAEARKDKDKGEVARLEAIHKLQQDAQAEEEKQLLAGGDANVKARDDALAAEQRAFEGQQDKIGTAAEQAAERKVQAAIRSGKAVSDENTLLLEQEKILTRTGRTAAPGAPAATPVVGVGAAAAAPPTTPGASLDTLAAALDAIAGAVNDAKAAIVGAQRDTTSAVKNIKGAVIA